MSKYPIKLKLYTCLGVILFLFFGDLVCHMALMRSKDDLALAIGKAVHQRITIDDTFFIFPNVIILKNLIVYSGEENARDQVVLVPQAILRISLREFLFRQVMHVTSLTVNSAKVLDYQYYNNRREELLEILKNLPFEDFRFSIMDAFVNLDQNEPFLRFMRINSFYAKKGDIVLAHGVITEDSYSNNEASEVRNLLRGVPLKWDLKGSFDGDEFVLRKLILSRDNFYLTLWGETINKDFKLKGYFLLDSHYKDKVVLDNDPNFVVRLSRFLALQWGMSNFAQLSRVDHYLLDIDSSIKISTDEIEIQHLGFSINNAPFDIKGKVSLHDALPFALNISTKPIYSKIKDLKNFERIELSVSGDLEDNKLQSQGQLKFSMGKNPADLKKISLDFNDMTFALQDSAHFRIHLNEGALSALRGERSYLLALKEGDVVVDLQDEQYKQIEFNFPLFDGMAHGRIGIKRNQQDPFISSNLYLYKMDLQKMEGLVPSLARAKGKLDGQVFFYNQPEVNFYGHLKINEGELSDKDLIGWVSEHFDLASSESFAFNNLSADFTINKQGMRWEDIELLSEKLEAQGYLKYGSNRTLSSKFSLLIPRRVMERSSYFKPLVKLAGPAADPIKFDVQLSGSMKSLNFQWSQSDLKQKIQERIPNFVERIIERKIETAVGKEPDLN